MGTYCSTLNKLSAKNFPTFFVYCKNLIRLHGEVCMLVVVEQDIANHLVEHREEGAQGSEPGEVHDVLLGGSVLEAFGNQVVRGKEWLDYCRNLVLHLKSILLTLER